MPQAMAEADSATGPLMRDPVDLQTPAGQAVARAALSTTKAAGRIPAGGVEAGASGDLRGRIRPLRNLAGSSVRQCAAHLCGTCSMSPHQSSASAGEFLASGQPEAGPDPHHAAGRMHSHVAGRRSRTHGRMAERRGRPRHWHGRAAQTRLRRGHGHAAEHDSQTLPPPHAAGDHSGESRSPGAGSEASAAPSAWLCKTR